MERGNEAAMGNWINRWFWPETVVDARHLAGGDSYANSALAAFENYASDPNIANAFQTAAVEFSLGMWSRAFMLAEADPLNQAITPLVQSQIARELLMRGNSVWEMRMNRFTGDFELLPVAKYEVAGNVSPSSWRYSIELNRPTGDPVKRNLPYAGILHIRYGATSEAPWKGISPLVRAGLTATQLAYIENSLTHDAKPRGGYILPVPEGLSVSTSDFIKANLAKAFGGVLPFETTTQGFGLGEHAAPRQDWVQTRIGATPPEANITLKESAALGIMSACGIPPSLYTSEGAAQRESYRHFLTNAVRAVGRIIAKEIAEKFEIPHFRFHFPEEFVSDISARSRGLASMIQSGVNVEDAYNIVGLNARQAPPVIVNSPQNNPQGEPNA